MRKTAMLKNNMILTKKKEKRKYMAENINVKV